MGLNGFAFETHVVNAMVHACGGAADILEPSDAHHVATLLVIRVRVEKVVAHVFQDGLQGLARHFGHGGIRVGGGGHVHQPLTRDGLAWQQRGAPAETGRKRDVGTLHVHQGVEQQLVARAVEVATAVERAFGDGQLFVELGLIRRTHAGDECVHLGVGGQHVGKHGQQLVAKVGDVFVFHLQVEHA